MGRVAHKTSSTRRLVTINELSSYFGVHRHTMTKYIAKYGKLDTRDLYSILDFCFWVVGEIKYILV